MTATRRSVLLGSAALASGRVATGASPSEAKEAKMPGLVRIVAGGQTGVDQAALTAALRIEVACGGWCPPGRVCDYGRIPDYFPLQETPYERSTEAPPDVARSLRTQWNVRDSDGTLILLLSGLNEADAGTQWTASCAKRYGRPVLVCDPRASDSVDKIISWLEEWQVRTLNMAGPKEADAPGIGGWSHNLLQQVFPATLAARPVAIDVLIAPDAMTVGKARELNRIILDYTNGASFALDDVRVPHVTLAQLFVNANDLGKLCDNLKATVKEVAPDLGKIRIEPDHGKPYAVSTPSEGTQAGPVLLQFEKDGLQRLHDRVTQTVLPYRSTTVGTDGAFAKNSQQPTISPSTIKYVAQFLDPDKRHSGPNYAPHITLGMAPKAFESQFSKLAPPDAMRAAGIAVYQLGDLGTAQRELCVVAGTGYVRP
jgi:hypothetical protein